MAVAREAAGGVAPYRSAPAPTERPTAPAIIECDALVHAFGAKTVLRGVTFRVPQGSKLVSGLA